MVEQKVVATTGNTLVAEAFRQCAPDVVAAYPITPQTTIVEEFAKFVAEGRVHTEYVCVESEHSALSACVGASAAGARVMTATSSQGLAYMWEQLHIASGLRCPIVMANANRALAAPINIHCDHSDIMGARDTGWIIYFAETAQEAYDNTLMALRVAEHPDVMLPVFTTLDGFITTHSIDRAEMMDDESVAKFVGEYTPEHALLDVENPVEPRQLRRSRRHLLRVQEGSAQRDGPLGRGHQETSAPSGPSSPAGPFDVIEGWGMEDADYVIVAIGSTAGNARHVARELRAAGHQGRRAQDPRLPPVPVRRALRRAQGRQGHRGPRPLRVLRRRGRSRLPRGQERALRPGEAPAGHQLHLRPRRRRREARTHRIRSSTTWSDLAAGTTEPGRLVYLGSR